MGRLLASVYLIGAMAFGQSAIAPPQIGFIQDANHSLRPIHGIAANFLVGEALGEGVVSSAFSGSFGIVKTGTSILVLDRDGEVLYNEDASSGPALFAFSQSGAPAFVYMPQSLALRAWRSDHFESAPFDPDQTGGTVLSIAVDASNSLQLLLQREDGIWLADSDGASRFLMPDPDGPVLLRNDGSIVFAKTAGLFLHRFNGEDLEIDTSDFQPAFLEQMGRNWIHATAQNSTRHYAVSLTPGHERIYELPENQPAEPQE